MISVCWRNCFKIFCLELTLFLQKWIRSLGRAIRIKKNQWNYREIEISLNAEKNSWDDLGSSTNFWTIFFDCFCDCRKVIIYVDQVFHITRNAIFHDFWPSPFRNAKLHKFYPCIFKGLRNKSLTSLDHHVFYGWPQSSARATWRTAEWN